MGGPPRATSFDQDDRDRRGHGRLAVRPPIRAYDLRPERMMRLGMGRNQTARFSDCVQFFVQRKGGERRRAQRERVAKLCAVVLGGGGRRSNYVAVGHKRTLVNANTTHDK